MNRMTRHTPRRLQSDVVGSADPLWPVSRAGDRRTAPGSR
jgi:hypothetical protein